MNKQTNRSEKMRNRLIALTCIVCAGIYTFFSVVIYQMMKETVYDSQFLTTLNKAMMVAFGIIVVGVPLLLLSKKNRKRFIDSIGAAVDDFMLEIFEPLKRNIKRKEFWILQGYVLTRILTFFNKFFFMVYVFPVVLFMIDPSKWTGTFVINLVTLMIFVNVARMFYSGSRSNWRRCFKQALHVVILVSTTRSLEKTYQSIKIVSTGDPLVNHELILIIVVLGSFLALRLIQKWILNNIEKDITIDKNPLFDKAVFGIPCYSFEIYKDLIKIESIDFKYQDFDQGGPHSVITFVGTLRYGLTQFEMEKRPTIVVADHMIDSKDAR